MTRPSPPRVPRLALRRTLHLSVLDALAYALMVGIGEAYFLADGIRLGASTLQLGLLVGLPLFAGGVGPLLALRLLPLLRTRRLFVAGAALGQALLLCGLALADGARVLTPTSLIAAVVLYQICGQAAGTTWSSWFGDLVPVRLRARFFARRIRATHGATCFGLVLGGLLLQWTEPGAGIRAGNGGQGFVLLYLGAALFRLISTGLLLASAEPAFSGLPNRARVVRFLRSSRGTVAWRLVLLVASMQFVVYIASPYFAPYQLEELHFSYAEFMLSSVVVVLFKILCLPAWGRAIDRYGARGLCVLAAFSIALVPLPWLWASGLGWVIVAQGFSGSAWAGFELTQFSLLLDSSYRSTRLHVFAAQSILNGTAQLLGGLSGAALAESLGSRRSIFAISLAARLALALCFLRFLPTPVRAPGAARLDRLLRLIGIRPSGLSYRPIAATHRPQDEPGVSPQSSPHAGT